MLPQNTYLIRQNERIIADGTFISILSPQLLSFLNESYFERTVFINSTPGGGKSTLLKTFSPEILLELKENHAKEVYKEAFEMLKSWKVVNETEVKLISIKIECARENYSLIDDLYDNGRAVAVFFELLSLRILRRTLSGILATNQLEEENLKDITFCDIPDEWKIMFPEGFTGKNVYQWALDCEHKLCNSIEEMDAGLTVSMSYNNLSVLNLISNGNILLYGEPIKQKMLIMFDDVHTLSSKQRQCLRDMIFKLRPNLGIWMSQRMVALSTKDIFGNDGRIHREYEVINMDEQIQANRKSFYKALKDVSDRRAGITYKNERLEDRLEKECPKDIKSKLESVQKSIVGEILKLVKDTQNFSNLIEYLEQKQFNSAWEKVKYWEVLQILIEREKRKGQIVLPFYSIYTVEEFLIEYERNRKTAEYFICYKYKLPIYYGEEILYMLSSFNVEQFLDFAGAVFELRIALDYVSKKKKTLMVTWKDQETAIVKCAEEKWNDILRTYSMGRQIQILLENIANIGIKHLEKNTISYSGGTYTGFGIKKSELDKVLAKDDSGEMVKLLKMCVVNNLLSCQEIRQGKEGVVHKVFYLNRWICAKFRLPLGYGGWKPLQWAEVNKLMCSEE